MKSLKDYVNWKLTHSEKSDDVIGYPLLLEKCKVNKKLKQLIVYGNNNGVGDLTSDGKYKVPIIARGVNLFDIDSWNAPEQTINGITFTPLDNERIHIKGKATNTSSAISYQKLIKEKQRISIKKGVYRGKPCKYSSASGFTFMFGISNGTKSVNINTKVSGTEVSFDNAYINYVQFYLSGSALNQEYDDIIEIQFMSGRTDLPFEPYVKPVNYNLFLNEPLFAEQYIDFKNKKVVKNSGDEVIDCQIPATIANTTIIEVSTSIEPLNAYCRYIKK